MLAGKMSSRNGVQQLLNDQRVRRAQFEGRTVFAAADVAGALAASDHAAELWEDLKAREPALATQVVDTPEFEAIDLAGVFRLVQALDTPRAERIKAWLAQTAVSGSRSRTTPSWRCCAPARRTSSRDTAASGSTSACAASVAARS